MRRTSRRTSSTSGGCYSCERGGVPLDSICHSAALYVTKGENIILSGEEEPRGKFDSHSSL